MPASDADSIVEQFKALTPEHQMMVAEAIDRLTWARRWRLICERIEQHAERFEPISDQEIDEEVRAVRRETPLSARSSTHRSSSAP